MTNNLPSVIHLFDTLPRFVPLSSIKEYLAITPTLINQLIELTDETVGIILDVETVTQEHCDLLQTYSLLSSGLGLCIFADECSLENLQDLSLLFHTIRFAPMALPNTYEHNSKDVQKFFISIANTKKCNNSLKTNMHRRNTLEALGIIAHQWRQPINLISMEAMNLMIQANINDTVHSFDVIKSTDLISEQVMRMSSILKSILDMGQVERVKTLFSINALFDTLKASFSNQLRYQGIELSVVPLNEDKQIYGFQTDLEEVLTNLIANAKDAYQTSHSTQKTITIDIETNKDYYSISVKDEAGGIDKSLQEKIFEPNFSTKKKGEGFGIGLHVARLIIEKEFKGSLHLQSHENETQFIITIPKNDLYNRKFIH